MKAILLAVFAVGASALAESAIPTGFGRERYQDTLTKSPFALATPVEKPVEEEKNPFDNLLVTGLGKLEDGRDIIWIQRLGEERSMRFEGNDPGPEGYVVKQVKWGERWSDTRVVMAQGDKQGEIKFKENSQPTAGAMPPGMNPAQRGVNGAGSAPPPIVPTGLNSAARPAAVPQRPPAMAPNLPRPNSPSVVPRPGAGAQLSPVNTFRGGTTAQPPVPTNGAAPRQRIRQINNR